MNLDYIDQFETKITTDGLILSYIPEQKNMAREKAPWRGHSNTTQIPTTFYIPMIHLVAGKKI